MSWDYIDFECRKCGWKGKGHQVKWIPEGPAALCPKCGQSSWVDRHKPNKVQMTVIGRKIDRQRDR